MIAHRVHSLFRSSFSLSKEKSTRSGRAASLRLENLEDRNVPSVAANDVYVSTLYQGFLGHNVDPAGLAYWDGRLNAGETRAQVALGIERSDEFIGRAVQIDYQDFLGRPADSAGLNFWVEAVRRGDTLEKVKASIIGSDEFFNRSGGNVSGYLNAVYKAELGRPIDAAGLSYWSNGRPNTPNGRAATAFGILRSTDGKEVEITSIYRATLNRVPDSAGQAFWVDAFRHGARDSEVIAGIVGSDEYFTELQSFAASGSDVNSAAHQFIASAKRFSGPLPGAEQLDATVTTDPSLVLPPPATPQPPFPTHRTEGYTGGSYATGGFYFIPGLITVGPVVSYGPVVTVGPGPVGTCGCSGGGGYSGGGYSGGGFGSGGSGGGSGSLRAAPAQDAASNGGVGGVGGRGQGGGLYVGGGLLRLPNQTLSSNQAARGDNPLPSVAAPRQDVLEPAISGAQDAAPGLGQLTNQQLQMTVSAALARLQEAGIDPALLARL